MPTVVPNAQKTHNFSEIWGTAWLGRRQHDIHSEDEFVLDEPFNGNIERQPVHRGTTADTVVTDEWRRYTGQPVPLALFFFFSTPGQKPLCHRQTIIRDTYIEYSCLQSRPSPGSRSSAKLKTVRGSRLKCIESPLIGFLYRAGAKKNSRSRFGPWRIVGDNLERAVGKLRENYSR